MLTTETIEHKLAICRGDINTNAVTPHCWENNHDMDWKQSINNRKQVFH